MRYAATMHAHCGMPYTLAEGDWEDCRAEVASFLRDHRAEGYGVSVLERGERWEAVEPDDAIMVPDDAGTITIQPSPALVPCWECGCDFQPESRMPRGFRGTCPDCANPSEEE